MSTAAAMELMTRLLETALFAVGPLLAVALLAGVVVGVLQTATQINEASISFLVKVIAVVAAGALVGPMLARHVVDYTRSSFTQIADVAR